MRAGCCVRDRVRLRVLGVNASETQSSIDAALTFGILWLDVCRQIPTSPKTGEKWGTHRV